MNASLFVSWFPNSQPKTHRKLKNRYSEVFLDILGLIYKHTRLLEGTKIFRLLSHLPIVDSYLLLYTSSEYTSSYRSC